MKKKIIILVAIVVLLVSWVSIAYSDYAKVAISFDKPKFCITTLTADDGGSGKYIGLGYSFDIDGHLDFNRGFEVDSYTYKIFGITIKQDEANPQKTEKNTESEIADKNISSPTSSYPTFSYEEESAIYVEGQPGVKTSGFVNTSEIKLGFDNIAEHAKKECTVKYYIIQTYFDSSTDMWKVVFNDENILGGDQTVYMTKNGITTLIVYGE